MIIFSGHDRLYTIPGGTEQQITGWQALGLAQDGDDWANGIIASLVPQELPDDGTAYFSELPPEEEDVIRKLFRTVGDDTYEVWTPEGWVVSDAEAEVMDLDNDLASALYDALVSGASGLALRYFDPIAWLPPSNDDTALPLAAAVPAGPDDNTPWHSFAVVDELDHGAVLNVIRMAPGPKLEAYTGSGKWEESPELLADLRGVTPPLLVEITDEKLDDVLRQVDVFYEENPVKDPKTTTAAGPSTAVREKAAEDGTALEDGSFPIRNKADLDKAVQAFGRAKDKDRAKRHIIKRARDLDAVDMLPESWGITASAEAEALIARSGPPESGGSSSGGSSWGAGAKSDYSWKSGSGGGVKHGGGGGGIKRSSSSASHHTGSSTSHSGSSGRKSGGGGGGGSGKGGWREEDHPRGKSGSPVGGKFVAKRGDGYGGGGKSSKETTSERDQTKQIQKVLVKKGLLKKNAGMNGNAVDGRLGPKTEAAIKRWQKHNKARINGKLTSGQLNKLLGHNPIRGSALSPLPGVSPDPRAEKLRRYWSIGGKGGLKIKWGLPGDWKRCVRYLSKYMGLRAKGYCQLMHKRNTGVYTGSKLNASVLPAIEEALSAALTVKLWRNEDGKVTDMQDGIYSEVVESEAAMVESLLAAAFPVAPPDEWFDDPKLEGPTPIQIGDDGRVKGHIATFDIAHIGMPGNVRAPKSKSQYAYFHTGDLVTASGKHIGVGQLTLAGGHAPLHADAGQAVKHYDDTASAIVDMRVGEDRFGIWAAGAVRPEATPEQLRALRASAPSGDWRPINGSLELVAVCQVNVPGFPVARARVASGAVCALVAAGARPLAEQRFAELADSALAARVTRLEALAASGIEEDDEFEPLAGEDEDGQDETADEEEQDEEPVNRDKIASIREMIREKKREELRQRVHPTVEANTETESKPVAASARQALRDRVHAR